MWATLKQRRVKQLRRIYEFISAVPLILKSALGLDFLKPKRILLIYDIRYFNAAIGDVITESINAHIADGSSGQRDFDIIFVVPTSAPFYPMGEIRGEFKVNESNYPSYLNEITLLGEFCGANQIYTFHSDNCALQFIFENYFKYRTIYRPLNEWWFHDIILSFYTPRMWNFDIVYRHVKAGNRIPTLTCYPIFQKWAAYFKNQYFKDAPLIVISLRLDSPNDPQRNMSQTDARQLINRLSRDKRLRFLVIGRPKGNSEFFADLPPDQFLFSKSLGLTVFQEFLLIQTCDLFIGSNTGPSNVALLGQRPYLFFDYSSDEIHPFSKHFYVDRPQNLTGCRNQKIVYNAGSVSDETKIELIANALSDLELSRSEIDPLSIQSTSS